ncbi:hypothetical protein ACXOLK_08690, partial [Streptococcus thermophilus]
GRLSRNSLFIISSLLKLVNSFFKSFGTFFIAEQVIWDFTSLSSLSNKVNKFFFRKTKRRY